MGNQSFVGLTIKLAFTTDKLFFLMRPFMFKEITIVGELFPTMWTRMVQAAAAFFTFSCSALSLALASFARRSASHCLSFGTACHPF